MQKILTLPHDIFMSESVELLGENMTFWRMRVFLARKGWTFRSQLFAQVSRGHEGETVLDVGCGYGPLGLSLAQGLWSLQATMVDINNRAWI